MYKLTEDKIRLIFGLKVRHLRTEQNLSLQEVADKSGLSVSYINEIEKGKKYPKTDKIADLAEALGTTYDQLVSTRLPRSLAPLVDIFNSGILDELPFEHFGIDYQKFVEIITQSPAKISAFISTYIDIARNYDLNKEKFLSAALRSYQELHDNYFPQLEKETELCARHFQIPLDAAANWEFLKDILTKQFGTIVTELNTTSETNVLQQLRALYYPDRNELSIHPGLHPYQKAFILAKEIGYHWLNLPLHERVYYYKDWNSTKTFDQALINFQASYFAGALLLPLQAFCSDVSYLLESMEFPGEFLESMLRKWNTSPETLMYRLTNILPGRFGLQKMFFFRFNQDGHRQSFHLSKELHLGNKHQPHGNESGEHYCRRWMSIKIFNELSQEKKQALGVQKSHYIDSGLEYIVISWARETLSKPFSRTSISIGLEINNETRKKIRWIDDPNIPTHKVNVTCERCRLDPCEERAAEPKIYRKLKEIQSIKQLLQSEGLIKE
ncbi:MAG: helix-turn-helix domain-containing protein [Thermaurantimonas sp.]|uniref:helix-turn-helix domain-containing protein n=1 Tax=Thermaurantimonas sp. TaxID=2681568 RepID=UPI00391BD66C